MEVLLAIVISVLFAFALRKQIKRYAVSFYIVAAAADVLFLSGVLFGVSREFAAAVYPYLAGGDAFELDVVAHVDFRVVLGFGSHRRVAGEVQIGRAHV